MPNADAELMNIGHALNKAGYLIKQWCEQIPQNCNECGWPACPICKINSLLVDWSRATIKETQE